MENDVPQCFKYQYFDKSTLCYIVQPLWNTVYQKDRRSLTAVLRLFHFLFFPHHSAGVKLSENRMQTCAAYGQTSDPQPQTPQGWNKFFV